MFFQQKYGVGLSRYVAELACFLLCDEIRYKKADQLRRDESHTQLFSYHSITRFPPATLEFITES